jgi:hypothetical protein
MKINELISNFTIFTTNEEQVVLDKLQAPCYYETFNERERRVIEGLVQKSMCSKFVKHGGMMVKRNEDN